MLKRIISVLLSLLLIFSVFPSAVVFADSSVDNAKMLYINTLENWKELYQRARLEAGQTYYFSFSISDGVEFKPICTTDGDRITVVADIKRVSKTENDGYSEYIYSYTIPETDQNGNALTENLFVGIAFTAPSECYFFNASVYNAADDAKTELFTNPCFSDGTLDDWAWGWDAWFGVWSDKGSSSWSNQTTTLFTVDYDLSVMAEKRPEKMLYINTSAPNDLMHQTSAEAGKTYNFTFSLSNSFEYFDVGCFTNGVRESVDVDPVLVKTVNKGGYSIYTYTVTIPEETPIQDGCIFFGIDPNTSDEGYLFNASVYETADTQKKELMKNPDFTYTGNALNGWCWGWEIIWLNGTEISNSTTSFKVVDYDAELLAVSPTMLYVKNESIDMNDEVLAQKIKKIEANVEYTVSFDRNFVSGFLGNQVRVILLGDDGDSSTIREGIIDFSTENEYITASYDDGVNLSYTFKLDSETAAKYESFYAGFYFRKYASRMITEFYVSDFVIYKAADIDKTNLFTKKSLCEMGGWYTLWHTSVSGSSVLDSQAISTLDYSAEYLEYDAELFEAEKNTVHYGDTNLDGNLDIRDLVAMKKKSIYEDELIFNSDCNADGAFNTDDLIMVRKHLLGVEQIEWESSKSSLLAVNKLSGGADSQAQAAKEKIAAKKDTVSSSKTYYVSSDGEYSNSGLSAESAVNIEKLRALSLSSGDAVLFKRGDIFRIAESITLTSGVSYGAYGTGDKPQILGSLRDYADNTIWSSEDGNLWSVKLDTSLAGNIVFNGGEYVGVLKTTLDKVKNDGDFYFDSATKTFYLMLKQYNPGNYFDSIEISSSGSAFNATGRSNITLENMDIKYIYAHGIHFVNCTGITVTGCNIGWIGGGYLTGTSRYGNGIEFWAGADQCSVTDNYFYQIYDAAMTFQGSSADGGVYTDLTFTGNLVEYASMNFEFWHGSDMNTVSNAQMKNIDFSNNILRFSGLGFSGMQRDDVGNQAFILAWHYSYEDGNIADFNIKNNIFDVASSYFYYASKIGDAVNITDNTYYQNGNSPYTTIEYNTFGGVIYSKDKESLESAVVTFDSNPNVNWLDS